MTPWDVLIALFSHVDEPLHAIPPPRRPAGPVRGAPWGGCLPSKVGGIGHFIAG